MVLFNWWHDDKVLGDKNIGDRIFDLLGGKIAKSLGWIIKLGFEGSEKMFALADWEKVSESIEIEDKAFKAVRKRKYKGIYIFEQEENNNILLNNSNLILSNKFISLFKNEEEAVNYATYLINSEIDNNTNEGVKNHINTQFQRYDVRRR